MIIRPLSDAQAYAAGGPLDPTSANFPSCKLFFPCTETSGQTLRDLIQGNTVSLGNNITNTDGIISATGGTIAEKKLASPIVVGAKSALLIYVGNVGALFTYRLNAVAGAGSGALIDITGSGNSEASDGTNVATAASVTTGSTYAHAMLYTPGTSNEGQAIRSTLTTYTADTAVSATPGDLTTMPTLNYLNLSSAGNAWSVGGFAFFVFNATPSANLIQRAITEMCANWQLNKKWLPSAFKGLA